MHWLVSRGPQLILHWQWISFCLWISASVLSLNSSVVKESACHCTRPRFDFWVGKFPWRRDRLPTPVFLGFPGGSDDEESACNAGDASSIPGSGSSPGEGIDYPFRYSWVFLAAQMVKNPPAMQETWVRSLGWGDPPEEGMVTHSSILAWRIPMDRGAWQTRVHGVVKSWTRLSDKE